MSNASHDSLCSRDFNRKIREMTAEMNDLRECAETELAIADEEKNKLRLERDKANASIHTLEGLIEAASLGDGGFDLEEALQAHDGHASLGSIPGMVIETDGKGSDSTLGVSSSSFDANILEGLLNHNNDGQQSQEDRRTKLRRSPGHTNNERSVVSAEHFNYAEEKIRRLRSRSVEPGTASARRAPRRGRKPKSGVQGVARGNQKASASASRNFDSDIDHSNTRASRRALKSATTRRLQKEAIAALKTQIKEEKEDIEKTTEKWEIRMESAEENATMMKDILATQQKKINELKVHVVSMKAKIHLKAANRKINGGDALKAAASDERLSREDREALLQLIESRRRVAELTKGAKEIETKVEENNARQAELLRRIPQVRAEGLVQQTKRRIKYNSLLSAINEQKIALEKALLESRIFRENSARVSKSLANVRTDASSDEELEEVHREFLLRTSELQKMRKRLDADIEAINALPDLQPKPSTVAQGAIELSNMVADSVAEIEREGSKWREEYAFLRVSQRRDVEIQQYEESIRDLSSEVKRLQREINAVKQGGEVLDETTTS